MVNRDELIEKFHERALEIYEEAKDAIGYNATRYLQKVRKDGGFKAAQSWLKPHGKEDRLSDGFNRLFKNNRLNISLEAVVIQEPWSQLFTGPELEIARSRLKRCGFFDQAAPKKRQETTLPDELDANGSLVEGTSTVRIVNAYERSEKARKKCLAHYGPNCVVCGLLFAERYGPQAEGIIHIHHLRSLSSIGNTYRVDPIRDLRPVCPNCHAVIHSQNPPYSISEVKRMIAETK